METIQKSEFEVVRYEKMRHLHIFLVNVLFRNMHEHSDFEFDIILKGRGKVRSRSGEVPVQPGTILLLNSYEPHEIASDTTESLQILSVQVSNHFCKEYFPRLHNVEFAACDLTKALDEDVLEKVRSLLLSATVRFFKEEPFFQFECVGRISLMLSLLLANLPHVVIDDQEYAVRKRKTARIRRITAYIDQHYKEKIMLPDLAEMEGITTTYLSHFFHDTFHMTFQEYLNRLRLEKALILMKDPSLYLVDICMECGFSDNKYLNRMFMKKFGCSASEYRKKRVVPNVNEDTAQRPAIYSELHHSHTEVLQILEQHLGKEKMKELCS